MKLRHMEIFHAVMVAETVTGAAKLLNMSQPAVSTMLRHTEDQLGFKLFDRVKGRLQATAEARALYGEVERVFGLVGDVRQLADDLLHARTGSLSIVTAPSLGIVTIPRAVTSFLKDRPNVRIRLHVRRRYEVIHMIASQSVDLGFMFLAVAHPSVTAQLLARGDIRCIMPNDHPLTAMAEVSPEDMVGYPIITYSHTQGLSPLVDAIFLDAKVDAKAPVEVGLISTAWSLVQGGAGIALVDQFSNMETIFPDVVVRPLKPSRTVALECLAPSGRPPSTLAKEFVAHVKTTISADGICKAV